MSKKRQQEIIDLLENTIIQEAKKPSGGNKEIIEQLSKRLETVKKMKLK